MPLNLFRNNKLNIYINKIYKILKIILPILFLIILFKNSYISIEPIKFLFDSGNINIISQIIFLSLLLSFFLYFRWIFCINIYDIKINFLKLVQINSEAYTVASFIPGQIGIDLLRIGKLRKIDSSRFKTKLLKATLLEKIFALLGQIFVLVFFIIKSDYNKIFFIISFCILIYLFLFFLKILKNNNLINKYISTINLNKIYFPLFFSILCNYISCYLIYIIAHGFNMKYSFPVISISSSLSNISSVIPISPNGIGLSEFIFSEVTQIISNLDENQSIATIYFSYRILILLSHFLIYYISNLFNLKSFKINA
tara:strand:- start:1771 stop:2706 length:936 start_codon:yes stop_codon:yes gene_type:complete